ncbi:MAG: hypothetical protein ABUL68_03065, partial [Pseudomonadota bacterium]
RRDGLLGRKSIYGFYMSQGWSDPPAGVGPDIEAEGYVYATKLYGPPLENGESTLRAISRNLPAFWRRVRLNTRALYGLYANPEYLGPRWEFIVLVLAALLLCGLVPPSHRLAACWLFALFGASHFLLIFHIDVRYPTVAIPPLLLLTAGSASYLFSRFRSLPRWLAAALAIWLLVSLECSARDQLVRLGNHPAKNTDGVLAMQSMGDFFRAVVPRPHLVKNREPHVGFEAPDPSPLFGEDQFLLGYFTRSAWVAHGAEGSLPRGRIYSYRECDDDYRFVPATKLAAGAAASGVKILAHYQDPVLGWYYLLQMNP